MGRVDAAAKTWMVRGLMLLGSRYDGPRGRSTSQPWRRRDQSHRHFRPTYGLIDHRPGAEGYVYRGRVNGALAVSRALGDFSSLAARTCRRRVAATPRPRRGYSVEVGRDGRDRCAPARYKNQPTLAPEEQLVSNAPGVTSRNRAADDQFVVLVSDGVSEQVSDEALVALVRAALVGGDDAADAAARAGTRSRRCASGAAASGAAAPPRPVDASPSRGAPPPARSQAAKRVLEWTLLLGGTDNATSVVQILDAKGLEALDEAAVATACTFADLPYPGCVRAGEALKLTSGDVERMDTVELLELVDAMGLGAYARPSGKTRPSKRTVRERYRTRRRRYRKIFAALDGVRLVNTPVKDLGLDVADKSYLEAALDWWKITQACRASSGIGAVGPETFDSQTL